MKRMYLLALMSALLLVLAVAAGPAAADSSLSSQTAKQVAGSVQAANSNAESTQYKPTNRNISVRVLSPGDNGSVSQSNESSAYSGAANDNTTAQSAAQTQAASGGAASAVQDAVQLAGNYQEANSNAESKQIHPTNENISVRVLSEGKDGDVSQTNSSKAKSYAGNWNDTKQDLAQTQTVAGGDKCCEKKDYGKEDYKDPGKEDYKDPGKEDHKDPGKDDYGKDHDKKQVCCHAGSTGIQAGGQLAFNGQSANSSATSTQYKPTNSNLSVRVLSDGADGNVTQTNSSEAKSFATNYNATGQKLEQVQALSGSGHCCYGGDIGIQAAAQKALNFQDANSNAESKQIHPENSNKSLRFKSLGGGGSVTQSNDSSAKSYAGNWNLTDQMLRQIQGPVI